MGGTIHRNAPPMPDQVVGGDGSVIYTRADIERGRPVWQSIGGMQLGSIWGHGGYVAPDWSADWLHREASAMLDLWANREAGAARFGELSEEQQAAYRGRLATRMRTNTYDARTGTIRSTPTARSQSSGSRRITTACSATIPRWPRCAKRMR